MINDNLVEIKGEPFIISMMYAGKENMTGQDVYRQIGFGDRAYVHKDMWKCLQQLIPWLQERNLKMKICDAYRPPLAHQKLKEIIPQPGFFASNPERSQHCHGTAVDVILTDADGNEFAYPTKVDAYDPDYAKEVQKGEMEGFFEHLKKARHDYENEAMAKEIANRRNLKSLMESIGLEAISSEWWHYDLPDGRSEAYPMIDFDPE